MLDLLKKCFVEFIGAFFLVLTVGFSVFVSQAGVMSAFAIGFMLMVMVYAGGHVSGGHYNPAVSLAAAMRGAINWKEFGAYTVAQLIGALWASFVVIYFTGTDLPVNDNFSLMSIFIGEIIFTFVLCYVVLHTATSKDNQGNSFYGLAIGATVVLAAISTGKVCLGAFNPAVILSLLTIGVVTCKAFFITVLANFIAGALAALTYKITNNDSN